MRLSTIALSLAAVASALPKRDSDQPVFASKVIFTPPADYIDPRVLYARSAQFADGTLVATWENYSPALSHVYFPIFRSTDGGKKWKEISRVKDTQQKWGLRYQPNLYVLPEDFGGYKADTLLLSGSSIPADLSKTQIELYASTDKGVTWEFVSHIAAGGRAVPNNTFTPVWEPFLMLHKKTLICYYSDQRENETHGQKIVHQTTTDLRKWGQVIDDVKYPTYTQRPGMPTVAALPNGKYIMAYEYGGGPAIAPAYKFPVYYRIASNPETFGHAAGISLKAADGKIPTGSPYVVWTRFGGENGTLIITAQSTKGVYINKGLGEGEWVYVGTPAARAYSRHLRVLNNDASKLLVLGAGELPPDAAQNKVEVTVVDMGKW